MAGSTGGSLWREAVTALHRCVCQVYPTDVSVTAVQQHAITCVMCIHHNADIPLVVLPVLARHLSGSVLTWNPSRALAAAHQEQQRDSPVLHINHVQQKLQAFFRVPAHPVYSRHRCLEASWAVLWASCLAV